MPSEDPAQRLDDILQNVGRIKDYVRGMDQAGFIEDNKTIDAVERCFERIAEAARKLGDQFDTDYPELNLHALRQFGSAHRHDHDSIQPDLLWEFTKSRINMLEEMAHAELRKLKN
ncbi:MAG: DUF86 domain-containing protein [Rhodospirillales bacterium]|nr:DUF86 domain-containing protein [Rhodospirillales bacterium]